MSQRVPILLEMSVPAVTLAVGYAMDNNVGYPTRDSLGSLGSYRIKMPNPIDFQLHDPPATTKGYILNFRTPKVINL